MGIPKLVEYYCMSYERKVQDYLSNETDEKYYFISEMTLTLAKKLGKENELQAVCTSSRPVDSLTYKYLPDRTYLDKQFPKVFSENLPEILLLIEQNFHYISRICSFLEEYSSEYTCQRDFMRPCIISWAITNCYLPESILKQLFAMVFRTFPFLFEQYKLKLLLDTRIGHFV